MPSVCCVWASVFELDKKVADFWTPLGRLWTLRWLVVAKALQLGYNLLHVDNDVMFTTDVYRCATQRHHHPMAAALLLCVAVNWSASLGSRCCLHVCRYPPCCLRDSGHAGVRLSQAQP
jgi:hypothetical protein